MMWCSIQPLSITLSTEQHKTEHRWLVACHLVIKWSSLLSLTISLPAIMLLAYLPHKSYYAVHKWSEVLHSKGMSSKWSTYIYGLHGIATKEKTKCSGIFWMRNILKSIIFWDMTPYPRRWYSSKPPLWKPQILHTEIFCFATECYYPTVAIRYGDLDKALVRDQLQIRERQCRDLIHVKAKHG
jgi:hypothetical protein